MKDAAGPEVDLLIVDEYQDLNQAEQRVLKELHKRGVAILAIGDDDQSIYSWRNAAPEGIRNFTTTFADPEFIAGGVDTGFLQRFLEKRGAAQEVRVHG